ncbi:hypothetical protein ACFL3C_03745 [Patescibacteria group bacterium]
MPQDDDNNIIDLSGNGSTEEEDILLSEAELLGTPAGNSGAGTGTTTGGTTKKQTATSKFHIPAAVQEKYPNLVPLILETESMDDEEREYWFQILPIMTPEQVGKFKDILISEKEQLAKLDAEYEDELAKINEKHVSEWQDFETKQERAQRMEAEVAYEEQESSTEEDLLSKLQNL